MLPTFTGPTYYMIYVFTMQFVVNVVVAVIVVVVVGNYIDVQALITHVVNIQQISGYTAGQH